MWNTRELHFPIILLPAVSCDKCSHSYYSCAFPASEASLLCCQQHAGKHLETFQHRVLIFKPMAQNHNIMLLKAARTNKTVSKCNMHLNKVYSHWVHSATKFRFEKMGGEAFSLVSTHVNVKLKSISYPAYFFHRRVICKEKNKFKNFSSNKTRRFRM